LLEHGLDAAERAVKLAQELGAQYAEARLHRVAGEYFTLRSGKVDPPEVHESYGLGLRVLVNGALAFGGTNLLSQERIRELVEGVIRRARAASPLVKTPIEFSQERAERATWSAREARPLLELGQGEALSLLKELDRVSLAAQDDVKLPFRLFGLGYSYEEKYFVNSEGASIRGLVPRLHFFSIVTALLGGVSAQRIRQEGMSGGLELLKALKLEEKVHEDVVILARVLKEAQPSPTGELDVVLGPEVSGLTSHESIGHPFEADRILGREGAQAGESYLDKGDMGRMLGGPEAIVSDDPTLPNSYGFHLYDDEGVPARKRRLLAGGRVNELLHNRQTAKAFGTSSNSAARAISFDVEPIVRMANTYIEPGDYELEEMIRDIELGLYIKSYREWNIDDKRLNQRYVGLEAYLIERGHLKHLVRDPVVEFTTPKYWSSIDARGKELEFWAGSCGKGDPMQPLPVWIGGPHVRVRKVRVLRR
jgi:TldD protein